MPSNSLQMSDLFHHCVSSVLTCCLGTEFDLMTTAEEAPMTKITATTSTINCLLNCFLDAFEFDVDFNRRAKVSLIDRFFLLL